MLLRERDLHGRIQQEPEYKYNSLIVVPALTAELDL